jgi:hypothetical protein
VQIRNFEFLQSYFYFIYLFIALKQFYQQGYFKTTVKFLLLNLSYSIVASIGIVFVLIISFAVF